MTREEYQQLVKSSGGFQKLDAETQQKILEATGEDMEAYMKIFTAEQDEVVDAKKDFVTTTVKVIENFNKNAKVTITVERKKDEVQATKQDIVISEKLLAEINNLP